MGKFSLVFGGAVWCCQNGRFSGVEEGGTHWIRRGLNTEHLRQYPQRPARLIVGLAYFVM